MQNMNNLLLRIDRRNPRLDDWGGGVTLGVQRYDRHGNPLRPSSPDRASPGELLDRAMNRDRVRMGPNGIGYVASEEIGSFGPWGDYTPVSPPPSKASGPLPGGLVAVGAGATPITETGGGTEWSTVPKPDGKASGSLWERFKQSLYEWKERKRLQIRNTLREFHNDPFKAATDTSAGVASTLTGGLTDQYHKACGYADGVDRNSASYATGQDGGEILGLAIRGANPCRMANGFARNSLRTINGMQAAGSAMAGYEAYQQGDYLGAAMGAAGAGLGLRGVFEACFAAGTPIRTPGGSNRIEELRVGDLVLSRDEFDADGPLLAKPVEERFVREALVWEIEIGGRTIRTTAEHPFWREGDGWTAVNRLLAGDRVLSESGEWATVGAIRATNDWITVYNVRVAESHTYFVGEAVDGSAVWVHNSYSGPFSLTPHGMRNYPPGVPKPTGPLTLIPKGPLYDQARKAANAENRRLHRNDPSLKGKNIHEIQPVKFGGSPTDPNNKIALDPPTHSQLTTWWNALQRSIESL
jgi:hypothetical protein